MTTTSLSEIEALEYRALSTLTGNSNLKPDARTRLVKALAQLRVLKKAWLAEHPSVLRKASGEGSYEQFQRDLAAAKLGRELPPRSIPKAVPTENETVYRAPENLRGLTLHTVSGMLTVPDHGIVHIASRPDGHADECECAKCSMHRDLRGRGFREQHARKSASEAALEEIRDIHRLATARQIAVQLIGKQHNSAAGDDIGAWLHARGSQAGISSETRQPQYDGPGPAPQYAANASEFRRQYYGSN